MVHLSFNVYIFTFNGRAEWWLACLPHCCEVWDSKFVSGLSHSQLPCDWQVINSGSPSPLSFIQN